MSDIVERIRNRINDAPMPTEHLLDEAADTLTALRAEVERMRGALEAVDRHHKSSFIGAQGDASERASWRGVIRKVRKALTQAKDTTDDA